MKVTVSGLYRHHIQGHTEHGLENYEVSMDVPVGTPPGQVLNLAKELIKGRDLTFASLKTHKIVWGQDDVEPTAESVEPAGPDSGTELFE